MQLEGEKNKNAFFLVMGIILIIGGLFFLNNYLMSSRINNPNNLSTLLKNNDLKEQANKKVVPKKIKDINELKVGTNNPFQLNVPQAAGEQGDKDNGLKSENNNLQNEQKN